nr:ribosomal protein L32 [Haematococcus lacustris]
MRKNVWKKKVEKQAIRSLFLAKYLVKTNPESIPVKTLLTRLDVEKSTNINTAD